MRWERLFGELEGYAEHLRLEERDALVVELREGEWAELSWIDTVAAGEVSIAVRDAGVLSGHVRMANDQVVHLETSTAMHVIATPAVEWVRGDGRAPRLDRESIAARLGWGPVFREAQDQGDGVRLSLVGGSIVDGVVTAVGRDFVRLTPATGRHRDVPTSAICMAILPR